MIAWWETLGSIGKVFAGVAIPATVILFLQTLLLLIGVGGHELGADSADLDSDADFGGDVHDGIFGDHDVAQDTEVGEDIGLRLLSFRGIIAFLTVLGWVGVLCVRLNLPTPLAVLLSALSGLAAMVMIALLFRLIYSLQADGTENIRNALGASGTVYLRIPPKRDGCGKINFLLDGKLVEKEAVTDETEMINYGEQVIVIGISGGSELIVKRKLQK